MQATTSIHIEHVVGATSLRDYVGATRREIEPSLMRHLPVIPGNAYRLFNDGVEYAVFPGGKRLRPVLTMLGAEVVGGCGEDVLAAAVAVEYLHSSSLIFDDLPCMDDAAQRRGRAALHVRYGESLAMLVGLALMNASYGLVLSGTKASPQRAIAAHAEMVDCIGSQGMVAGQYADISPASHDSLHGRDEGIHDLKTSALIRLALGLGAILSGATAKQIEVLRQFAQLIGEAYQLRDDMLDVAEDSALKPTGSRYTTLLSGTEQHDDKCRLTLLLEHAKDCILSEFGATPSALLLCRMSDYIGARSH